MDRDNWLVRDDLHDAGNESNDNRGDVAMDDDGLPGGRVSGVTNSSRRSQRIV